MSLVILGDSIAVGIGSKLGGGKTVAEVGATPSKIATYTLPKADWYIVSMGSNDNTNSGMIALKAALEVTFDRYKDAKWIYVLPAKEPARGVVYDFTQRHGARSISFIPSSTDVLGIHPSDYNSLAQAAMAFLHAEDPSSLTPLQKIVIKYDQHVRERIGGQDFHRAAVYGQSKQEANENPAAEEVKGSDHMGIGLIQWTGPRHRQLVAFASARGKPWQDVGIQMDFICYELGPPDPAQPGSGALHSKWLLIQRTTTLKTATETVMAYYEGPAGWKQELVKYGSTTANMPRRLAGAQEALEAIQMLSKPATEPPEKKMAEVPTEPSNAEILAEIKELRGTVETVAEQAAAKFGVPVFAVQMLEKIVINPLLDRMDPEIAAKIDGNAVAEGIVHILGAGASYASQFLSGKLALPAPTKEQQL